MLCHGVAVSRTVVHDPLKCGECGCETFRLVHVNGPDDARFGGGAGGEVTGHVVVKCTKCGYGSKLGVSRPTLTAEGPLCGGWS